MDPEDPSEESESPYAHVDFYEILGLDRECTASDVKKAFRKRALETHPDRGGDPEEFKRVGKAKDVLSDPQRRKYYDVYGEDGVEFFERWQSADPNEMLAQVGSGGIVCFCITNLMCVAFLLCFPIFLMVREDDWMWGWVFAPIWVIDALVLLMLATAPLLPYNMGNKSNLLSACMWTEMLQLICFIIWQALVCASLEYPNWIDWIVVFVPIFGVQAIQSVKAIVQCLPEQYQAAARIKTPGSQLGHLAWIAYLSLEQLAAWSAWIVIPLRMDETIDGSWWLVSVPLFILVGFGLYAASRDPRRAKDADDLDEVTYEQAFSRWKFAAWIFVLASIIFVCLYVDGQVETGIYFIFLPMFIVLGAFALAICYTSASLIKQERNLSSNPWDSPDSDQENGSRSDEEDTLLSDHDDDGPAPGAEYGAGVRKERHDPNVYEDYVDDS